VSDPIPPRKPSEPAPRDLRQFLSILRQERLLVEVEAEIVPDLELNQDDPGFCANN
jgi:hypothetical protein